MTRKYKIKNKSKRKLKGGGVQLIKEITVSTIYGFLYSIGTIISFPLKTIDQLIPINLCKKLTKNSKVCSQKISEYLITGSKLDDLEKIDVKDDCVKLNDSNEYVKCKPDIKGGSSNVNLTMDKIRIDRIREKLKTLNLFLRQYKKPKEKMETLISTINDIELLKLVLNTYENILNGKGDYVSDPNLDTCDKRYYDNAKSIPLQEASIQYYDLRTLVDDEYTSPYKEKCVECSGWQESFIGILKKYGELLNYTLRGNKKNIYYILMKMLNEIVVNYNYIKKNGTGLPSNDVINDIILLLNNINCRCNIIELIQNQIEKLTKLKN